ncbi:MAG: prenyltransferase/squalene oxidase repeat-containing protein [Planctomycetota bacterium]
MLIRKQILYLFVIVILSGMSVSAQGTDPADPEQQIFRHTQDVTPESYAAAQKGLAFLAKHQNRDGSWNGDVGFKLNQEYKVTDYSCPHPGVTALAGIAFLSGGHLPERGIYSETIARCIDYILSTVRNTGFVTANNTRMYSHAFATLFLAEVYGMTHRADVGKKLQEAVDLIVECQNKLGSWRYEPFAPEADMSVTVCQLMALRAARNIGIKVPRSTIDRAVDYVRGSYVGKNSPYLNPRFNLFLRTPYYFIEEGSFLYQTYSPTNNNNTGFYRSSYSLTSAGVVSLFNAGRYSEEEIRASLDYILRKYDLVTDQWRHHYFFWYGNYYAVQAMYIAGGSYWNAYYPRIRRELISSQRSSGYWENTDGPGENFATAVAIIILQIPFNYLPIFQR